MEFDEESWRQTEERLDQIHSLQNKYGASVLAIQASLEEKRKRLEELENYDAFRGTDGKEAENFHGSSLQTLYRLIRNT